MLRAVIAHLLEPAAPVQRNPNLEHSARPNMPIEAKSKWRGGATVTTELTAVNFRSLSEA